LKRQAVPPMSANDKQGIEEQDLKALEIRVEELIRACTHLKDENKTLRAREQQLAGERDRLAAKNDKAKGRVEDMLQRLKRLENEA
jgi:cell division protein ZapB